MATLSTTPSSTSKMSTGSGFAAKSKALASRAVDRLASSPKLKFAGDFASAFNKNIGNMALESGKSLARSPFRVATSLAEAPLAFATGGKSTLNPYNIPGLGQIKTYSREARDKINAGDGGGLTTAATILGTGGQAILDTATLGSIAQGVKNKFFSKTATTQAASATPKQTALESKISGTKPTINVGGKDWTVDQIHNTPSSALKQLSPADYKKLTDFDVLQSRGMNFQGGRTGSINLLDDAGKAPTPTPATTPKPSINVLDKGYKPAPLTPSSEILKQGRAYNQSVEKIISDTEGWAPGVKKLFDEAMLKGDQMTVKAILKAQGVPSTYQKTFSKEITNILKGANAFAR